MGNVNFDGPVDQPTNIPMERKVSFMPSNAEDEEDINQGQSFT